MSTFVKAILIWLPLAAIAAFMLGAFIRVGKRAQVDCEKQAHTRVPENQIESDIEAESVTTSAQKKTASKNY